MLFDGVGHEYWEAHPAVRDCTMIDWDEVALANLGVAMPGDLAASLLRHSSDSEHDLALDVLNFGALAGFAGGATRFYYCSLSRWTQSHYSSREAEGGSPTNSPSKSPSRTVIALTLSSATNANLKVLCRPLRRSPVP